MPSTRKISVNQGVVLNRLSMYTPIKSPIKMESATDKPMLAKYASSFMVRLVSLFKEKNTFLNKGHSKIRVIKDVEPLTQDCVYVNLKSFKLKKPFHW